MTTTKATRPPTAAPSGAHLRPSRVKGSTVFFDADAILEIVRAHVERVNGPRAARRARFTIGGEVAVDSAAA